MTPYFQRFCKVASYLNFICTLLLKAIFYCTPAPQESLIGFTAVVVWKVFAYAVQKYFPYEHEVRNSFITSTTIQMLLCLLLNEVWSWEKIFLTDLIWYVITNNDKRRGFLQFLCRCNVHSREEFSSLWRTLELLPSFWSHIEFLFLLVVTFNLSRLQNFTQKIENSSNFR